MTMQTVTSSQVSAVGWENDILVVRFTTGQVYAYSNVPYKLYKELLDADSVGHKLNESLKYNSAHPCTKLSA